jgi:hypothetical protein
MQARGAKREGVRDAFMAFFGEGGEEFAGGDFVEAQEGVGGGEDDFIAGGGEGGGLEGVSGACEADYELSIPV